MKKLFKRFKKGVASFYVVAFSTLILVVVASSFAMVIVSEVTRSSNDDLSQSAYDSALAGVEDAKVAYSNYQKCLEKAASDPSIKAEQPVGDNSAVTCSDIIWWMEHPDCYMVGHILGRIPKGAEEEVMVGEVSSSSDGGTPVTTNQAYTCVKITTQLEDYRSSLTTANEVRMVKIRFKNPELADKLDKIKLSWFVLRSDISYNFVNIMNERQVVFRPKNETPIGAPPVMEFQMVQSTNEFTINELTQGSVGQQTDRATLYLVPARNDSNGNPVGTNTISSAEVASTNNRATKNTPFVISCDEKSAEGYICNTTISVPEPIGHDSNDPSRKRSNDTLMFLLSLPYRQPDTDFSLQFYCDTSYAECATTTSTGEVVAKPISLADAQVQIDSTGRANDLFRRVETRLEPLDVAFPYPYYALQLLGTDNEDELKKNMIVTCENGLYYRIGGNNNWQPYCGNIAY